MVKKFSSCDLNLYFQVEMSTEHSIEGLSDEIINCGYTGSISVQNKESIVRYVRTYISVCTVKLIKGIFFVAIVFLSTIVVPLYSMQC